MKEIKLNPVNKNLSKEEEINLIKLKNSKITATGDLFGVSFSNMSYKSGFGSDIWIEPNDLNIDLIFIRDRIKTYFVNLFEWDYKIDDDKMKHLFTRKLEYILFRYGKVAIIKLPDGNFFPFPYVHKELDIYDEPIKISILSKNGSLNKKIYKKGEFVIIYNNDSKLPTLGLAWNRLIQINRALIDVDNSMLLARAKWAFPITKDDTIMEDAEIQMRNDNAFIKLSDDLIRDNTIQLLQADDRSMQKTELYQFQLTNLLKMLGLKVNNANMKKERVTEIEIARNDEFNDLLIQDMWRCRNEKISEMKKFGIYMEIKEIELEEKEKDELNGEVNKNEDREEIQQ